jgi:hypothetical protein
METKQLNEYKIEFYSTKEWRNRPGYIDFVYVGSVSNIDLDLCENIVDIISENDLDEIELSLPIEERFAGYKNYKDKAYSVKTAKESFLTLSDLEYCVIIKL